MRNISPKFFPSRMFYSYLERIGWDSPPWRWSEPLYPWGFRHLCHSQLPSAAASDPCIPGTERPWRGCHVPELRLCYMVRQQTGGLMCFMILPPANMQIQIKHFVFLIPWPSESITKCLTCHWRRLHQPAAQRCAEAGVSTGLAARDASCSVK